MQYKRALKYGLRCLLFTLMALAVSYSALWYYIADEVERQIKWNLAQSQASIQNLSVNGFPFSFHVNLSEFNHSRLHIPDLKISTASSDIIFAFMREDIALSVTASHIKLPSDPLLATELQYITEMAAHIRLSNPPPFTITRAQLAKWQAGDGRLYIDGLSITWPEMSVHISEGTAWLSPALQPEFQIMLTAKNYRKFLNVVVQTGQIHEKELRNASIALAFIAKGTRDIQVPLILQNKNLMAGPLRIMTITEFIWPESSF